MHSKTSSAQALTRGSFKSTLFEPQILFHPQINKTRTSKSKIRAHNRLYNDSKVLKRPEILNIRKSQSYSSRVHQKLFQDSQTLDLKNWRKSIKHKKSPSELTFRPSINKTSSKQSILKPEKTLIQNAVQKRVNLQILSSKIYRSRMNECSFAPKIDPKSSELQENKGSRFELLYQDFQIRQERLIQLTQPKKLAPCRLSQDTKQFFDRLSKTKAQRDKQLKKLQKQAQRNTDKQTGQPLFRPRVNPNTINREGSVWEDLYQQARTKNVRME